MLRTLLAALVAVTLITLPFQTASAAKDFPALFDAVRPLQSDPANAQTVFCTATQIDKVRHFWLTATHCVIHGGPLFIGDAAALILHMLPVEDGDITILYSPLATAPSDVKMSKTPPRRGDRITVIGFPAGIGPIVTQGYVGNPRVYFTYYDEWLMSLDVSICGGNSGSAVLNSKGEVISVLTRYHYPRPPCMALAGGPPWAQLVSFAHEYFRR